MELDWDCVDLSSYLLQFVSGGRDDPDPEVNLDAFRVGVQNTRKLRRNTNTFF